MRDEGKAWDLSYALILRLTLIPPISTLTSSLRPPPHDFTLIPHPSALIPR